ncbi:siderophore-interacting protein [Nocardioides sp. zg-1228]|uniref:siderophore-interacting protein n=1 Tax=Nocardioides sp. zg-1228 TaxID=2763008 RepID=UPI0016426683|nr:siderophore-interacting protein [Nocardioides sp. zg-1228]MBC2931589.1 siderophore-interacting protein [Nocardioides sp. zg-1228]QSF57186.1 siderophore-interacting protein [Nocardioides sp. zg-1228]
MTAIDRSHPGPRVRAHQLDGRGTRRVGYPIGIRTATVVARTQVTPHMLRLTVASPAVKHVVTHACDDHVGIVFPLPDGTRNDPVHDPERQMLDWRSPQPPMRKYTIRRLDTETGELDLDVVLHPGGLASAWASQAEVGAEVVLAGPPGALAFPHTYDHYVFAVDTTAIPALARWLDEGDWLEERGVSVQVVVDHDHPDETRYPLRQRPGVHVEWLPRAGGSRLAEVVTGLDLGGHDPADVFLFAAGEAGDIKPLRRWAKDRGVDALVTGYWKRGATEHDDHDEHDHDDHDHDEE